VVVTSFKARVGLLVHYDSLLITEDLDPLIASGESSRGQFPEAPQEPESPHSGSQFANLQVYRPWSSRNGRCRECVRIPANQKRRSHGHRDTYGT
jgi:hypothetical protein